MSRDCQQRADGHHESLYINVHSHTQTPTDKQQALRCSFSNGILSLIMCRTHTHTHTLAYPPPQLYVLRVWWSCAKSSRCARCGNETICHGGGTQHARTGKITRILCVCARPYAVCACVRVCVPVLQNMYGIRYTIRAMPCQVCAHGIRESVHVSARIVRHVRFANAEKWERETQRRRVRSTHFRIRQTKKGTREYNQANAC